MIDKEPVVAITDFGGKRLFFTEKAIYQELPRELQSPISPAVTLLKYSEAGL